MIAGPDVRCAAGAQRQMAIARLTAEWGDPTRVREDTYAFEDCEIFIAGDFAGLERFSGRLNRRRALGFCFDALSSGEPVPTSPESALGAVCLRDPPIAELVAINAFERGKGIGTALIEAVAASLLGFDSLRLTTTNDNLDALRFYQRRGFQLSALRPGAVDAARRLKPSIPALGDYGIPLRDEIDLVLRLPGG